MKSLMQEAYEKELRKISSSDKMLKSFRVDAVVLNSWIRNPGKSVVPPMQLPGSGSVATWKLLVWDECSEYLATQPREPISEETCECGSGSNAIGQGHYHWCRRYLAGG